MQTQVTFILTAETVGDATGGILLGDFNHWDKENGLSLTKQIDGSLHTIVTLKVGKSYQYRYLLDDGRWVNDERVCSDSENCVIDVPVKEDSADKSKARAVKTKVATVKKDDLTKIEGIGKKIAELLMAENIDSFEALSKETTPKLKAILDAAGSRFKFYDPSSWAKQAELVANGKLDELKKLQRELKSAKQ